MAIVLGLLTAALFGAGDFFGGLSTKRVSVVVVIAIAHLIGLISITLVAPFVADEFLTRDFLVGIAAGVAGGLGVALLYRGLAQGPMAVVAPLTAITSAAIPSLWGVAGGESFTLVAWAGILLAGVAIVLTSLPGNQRARKAQIAPRVVVESLLSGAFFGVFFILFDTTSDTTAPWPVVGSRLITASILLLWLVAARRSELHALTSVEGRKVLPLVALAGLFDTASNALFLMATSFGDLTIVAVLSSLYPASTVLLARFVLDERMSRVQFAGLMAAIGATILIALG